MEDDTKTCPMCGETIKRVAIKCKHCQSRLDGVAREGPATSGSSGLGGLFGALLFVLGIGTCAAAPFNPGSELTLAAVAILLLLFSNIVGRK